MFWLGVILPIVNWLSFSLIAYAHIPAQALTGSWFLLFLAFAYWIGWASASLRPLFRGLAVGLSISSAVAVGQAFGWGPASDNLPAGLLYNSTIQAAAIALVMLALVALHDWRYIPSLLPGLWLAHSRGGYLILAIGIVSRLGWQAVVLTMAAGAAVTVTWLGSSDTDRLMIWGVAWRGLEWFGHGPGSFANLLFAAPDGVHYPGHVHNDYLQLAYELGIWAIPVYLVYAVALARTSSRYWPAFAGFAAASVFFFPFYAPIPAFMGAVLAGHVTGNR